MVVRSVWDYPRRREELLDWAERVAALAPLANPPPILRWNSDKRYLLDLARAGVAVVPTVIAAPGEPVAWPEGEVVVKPTVSAGSIDTDRYPEERRGEARAHVARLHADGRSAMIQPYLSAVESRGETALVYVDGAMVHTVRKGPMLMPGLVTVGGLFVEEDIRPAVAGDAERRLAERTLAAIPGPDAPLLYARVDLVFTDDGEPLLLELELVEPSLFLAYGPGVAGALVRAIARRVSRLGAARRSPGESPDSKENP